MVTISKEEHIRLRWEAAYWHGQHQQGLRREVVLKEKIETLEARVRDLRQRLFGRKTEKSGTDHEGQEKPAASRPRGQQPESRGHGRTSWTHLPEREQQSDLSAAEKGCPECGKPVVEFPGTEDSEVIEIEVQAYRRVIRRKRYQPSCGCGKLPGIITAPAPVRLIPKGLLGISVWVEILLGKYLYAQPTNRLLQSWATVDLNISQGTIIGGLKRLSPLFTPVVEALQRRQLTEGYCHADETGWKVFEPIEGKVGYKWYLWVIRSASAIVYVMAPGRGASVPLAYFSKLLVQTILVCDRYSAYKKFARTMGVLLAFCWAHCRRDHLELARSYPQLQAWAMDWVERIGTLYHLNDARLEVQADAVSFAQRDAQLRAHLQQMRAQCERGLADKSLHRAARKVLESLKNHWEGLTVFVDHLEVRMDNNTVESALRNEVLGRKAYYGSGSVWAAELAALLFSLLMTLVHCWQINPRLWLQEYLQACADNGHRPPDDLSPFLPWAMSAQRLVGLRMRSNLQPADPQLGTGIAMDTS
jgi:transposase